MDNMAVLAKLHGTDKLKHGYIPVYERYFGSVRLNEISVLEIGVAGGASLRMWRDYFPNARIVGMDSGDAPDSIKNQDIEFIKGDQWRDIDLLLNQEFHIIIDDASHRDSDMQYTFGKLLPRLKTGGIYAIEDLGARRSPPPKRPICPNTKKLLAGLKQKKLFESPVLTSDECKYIRRNISGVEIVKRLCVMVKK